MSGLVGFDILIGRIFLVASDISDGGAQYSGSLVHIVLYSPEASGGEDSCLGAWPSVLQVQYVAAAALVELAVVVVEQTLDCQVVLQLGIGYDILEAHFDVVVLKIVEDERVDAFVLVLRDDTDKIALDCVECPE